MAMSYKDYAAVKIANHKTTMKQRLNEPMDKVWLRLRSLKAKVFDHEIIIQEPNKKVKDVFKALGIIMPTKLGV